MHMFKKLALAAAIASTPMLATSLELLDDAVLSGVTGQDGISIKLEANISVDLAIEDTSGASLGNKLIDNPDYDPNKADEQHSDYDLDYNIPKSVLSAAEYTTNGGFIVMKGLHVQSDEITIDIDSGSTGAGANKGVLVVGVEIDGLLVHGGETAPGSGDYKAFEIGVAGSSLAQGGTNANVIPATARDVSTGFERAEAAVGASTTIVSVGALNIGNVRAGIELGPEASQFMTLQTDAFNLDIAGFSITDPTSGTSLADMGVMGIQHIAIKNVEVDATVSITEDGLEVKSGDSSMDIALMGVGFGNTAGFTEVTDPTYVTTGAEKWGTIGNVYLLNLNMADTTIAISGR